MANTLISGSICLTDLVEKAKAGHSAFVRGKNGKVYVNITQWLNEEPDKYGNHTSYQLNSHKDKRDQEGKTYIGNGKVMQAGGGEAVQSDAPDLNNALDDLPF